MCSALCGEAIRFYGLSLMVCACVVVFLVVPGKNLNADFDYDEGRPFEDPWSSQPVVDTALMNTRISATAAHAFFMVLGVAVAFPIAVAATSSKKPASISVLLYLSAAALATAGVVLMGDIWAAPSMHTTIGYLTVLFMWAMTVLAAVQAKLPPSCVRTKGAFLGLGFVCVLFMLGPLQVWGGVNVLFAINTDSGLLGQFVAHLFAWWIYCCAGTLYLLSTRLPKDRPDFVPPAVYRIEHRMMFFTGIFYMLGEKAACLQEGLNCPDWTSPHVLQGMNFGLTGLLGLCLEVVHPVGAKKGLPMTLMLFWMGVLYVQHHQANATALLGHQFHGMMLLLTCLTRALNQIEYCAFFMLATGWSLMMSSVPATVFAIGYDIKSLHYCMNMILLPMVHMIMLLGLFHIGNFNASCIVDYAPSFCSRVSREDSDQQGSYTQVHVNSAGKEDVSMYVMGEGSSKAGVSSEFFDVDGDDDLDISEDI